MALISPFQAIRLPVNPIIHPHMDDRMGRNVQGPSLIRVPDWVAQPLGRYYLYFADHKGSYIRLAYADDLQGPWKIHRDGALQLAQSRFPVSDIAVPPDATEILRESHLPGRAPPDTPGIPDPMEDATIPHIASPDVHVDHQRKRIVMYFHGLQAFRTQRTRVALSADGIHFEAREEILGPSYFRVFQHGGAAYAIAMPGILYRSDDGLTNFERGPVLFEATQRHTAVLKRGNTLHVFWSNVGDAPERIYCSDIALSGDWRQWRAGAAAEIIRPETAWEGAGLPLAPSYRGAINADVRQLRDPAIFEEDGVAYLLYAVRGEAGIGIARLQPQFSK